MAEARGTRTGDFTYDVALLFADEQRTYVQKVAAALRRLGIRPFYDDYEQAALWGRDLYEHLDWVYQKAARYSVLFASEAYASKVWTTHERRSAQTRALQAQEYVLLVRFDDIEIPGLRPTDAYVDGRTTQPGELAALIAEKLGPSSTDPSRTQHWFISAPAEVDLGPLLANLQRRGVTPYVLSDVAPLGANILQSVEQAITQADRVLVVLTPARRDSNAFNSVFEAGIATGLRKPVVLIVDPDIPVPSDLAGFLAVRARADDLDAISFALDHAEQRPDISPQPRGATSVALGSSADLLIRRAVNLLNKPSALERDFVDLLVEALELSGAVTAVEPRAGDFQFDAAVWTDDLDAIAANPLLVEVKRSFRVEAVEQVLRYIRASPSARMALIVYLDAVKARPAELLAARFPVLAISLVDLLERMRTASFAEVVRDLRNRSVHGLPPS